MAQTCRAEPLTTAMLSCLRCQGDATVNHFVIWHAYTAGSSSDFLEHLTTVKLCVYKIVLNLHILFFFLLLLQHICEALFLSFSHSNWVAHICFLSAILIILFHIVEWFVVTVPVVTGQVITPQVCFVQFPEWKKEQCSDKNPASSNLKITLSWYEKGLNHTLSHYGTWTEQWFNKMPSGQIPLAQL